MAQKILRGLWMVIASAISLVTGFIGTFAFIPFLTSDLVLSALLSLILIFCAGYVLMLPASQRQFGRKAVLLAALPVFLMILIVAISNLAGLMRQPIPITDDLLAALEAHTIPLESVDSTELDALDPFLADRKVVALGEATHGTSEFFRMKHSVIAHLVTDLGYRNYGMEISLEDGIYLNQYIHVEAIDPTAILYWPWATEEVMAMLDWMRQYNADAAPADQLTLFGIDPRMGDRDRVMAENVTQIVETYGPIVLWAHNTHIWGDHGGMGAYLKATYGDDAYLLGFEFSRGQFTSRTSVIHTFEVGNAPPTFYAHALAKLDAPLLFLDMDSMQQNPLLDEWLNTPQLTYQLAEFYHTARWLPQTRTFDKALPEVYDGIIFVEESTPAQALSSVH